MTEISSEKQNEKQTEIQENLLMWIIRYVLIPLVLAWIAGFFALEVVDRTAKYQPNDDTSSEIFATTTATVATAQSTPSLVPTATAVPTQTKEADSGEANKPPITPDSPLTEPSLVCPQAPFGWQLYTVQPGNTLFSLARRTGTTVETIRQVNCLYGQLLAYSQIWLPDVYIGKPEPTVETTPVVEPSETITPTVTVTEPTPLPDIVNDTTDWPAFALSCNKLCMLTINFAVANVGSANTGPFIIQIQSDSGAMLEQTVAGLESGAVQTFSLSSQQMSSCTQQGCEICIEVDAYNEVAEESEANNLYCETVEGRG